MGLTIVFFQNTIRLCIIGFDTVCTFQFAFFTNTFIVLAGIYIINFSVICIRTPIKLACIIIMARCIECLCHINFFRGRSFSLIRSRIGTFFVCNACDFFFRYWLSRRIKILDHFPVIGHFHRPCVNAIFNTCTRLGGASFFWTALHGG